MKRLTLACVLLFTLVAGSSAQTFPKPQGFVNDYAGVMSSGDRQRLESLGREIQQKADIEFAFVTIDTIPEGEDISLYTVELGHAWGVGKKGADRGAVLLYKTGRSDGSGRQVYLATGYGLEGQVPDGVAGRILDQVTIPYLSQEKILEGFAATAVAVVQRVEPKVRLTGEMSRQVQWDNKGREMSPIGIIFMIILFIVLMSSRTGRAILFGMLLSSMFGRRGGGWGGGGFGGGGFGGGFGGFGGGGFGGGGAGRSF
ncbi:MAG: TPM domain-containing protein [bacterium]